MYLCHVYVEIFLCPLIFFASRNRVKQIIKKKDWIKTILENVSTLLCSSYFLSPLTIHKIHKFQWLSETRPLTMTFDQPLLFALMDQFCVSVQYKNSRRGCLLWKYTCLLASIWHYEQDWFLKWHWRLFSCHT